MTIHKQQAPGRLSLARVLEILATAPGDLGMATVKVWGLYLAGSRLGFEHNVIQLNHALAHNCDQDARLPLRPWWRP